MITLRKIVFMAFALFCTNAYAEEELSIYKIIDEENTEAFNQLYVMGYGIDEQDLDGLTPLMLAAANGKANFVSFLLKNNANVNKKSYVGQTALHWAALGGHNEVINILLGGGAEINVPDFDGMTPLMMAAKNGKRFSVELLVKKGAAINFHNAMDQTALDIAREGRYKDIVDFLTVHKYSQH